MHYVQVFADGIRDVRQCVCLGIALRVASRQTGDGDGESFIRFFSKDGILHDGLPSPKKLFARIVLTFTLILILFPYPHKLSPDRPVARSRTYPSTRIPSTCVPDRP